MKRQITFVLIALIVAALFTTGTRAQSSTTVYQVPRAVNLDPIVRRQFRSFWVRLYPGGPIQGLSTDGFYPIGWSRDGKFAYYFEPVDEECGCYFAELVIMDLRSDKVLWHFKNDWESRVDKEGAPIPDDIRKLWGRHRKEFSEKLREHGIVQTARFSLLPSTFTVRGKTFSAKVTRVRGDDGDGLNRLRKLSLDISSPSLGKKSLYNAEHKGDDMYVAPLDAGVAGAFKSPYEDRVAVVMLKVQRGWEGPPHTVEVQIAGADLERGFKKQ